MFPYLFIFEILKGRRFDPYPLDLPLSTKGGMVRGSRAELW